MKKIINFFAMCLVGVFAFVGCASAPKMKDVSGPTEIIEHKGTAFGVAQPNWVQEVLFTSNQKALQKALGIDKHVWVVTKQGENLDFVSNWADQVEARAQISASIKQGISDFVGAHLVGDDGDVEETVERYSARASAITVSGLNKEADWWFRGITKADKKAGLEPKYTYLVVYSLDEDLYQKQIKKAFNGEDDKVVNDLIHYLMNYTMVLGKD